MKSLAVVSADKVGLLADISYILAKSRVNIESINVAIVAGTAVICMDVSDSQKGKEVLEASGYTVEKDSVVVKIDNSRVEGLPSDLAKEGVTVQKSSTLTRDDKVSVVSLHVDKPKRASSVLQEKLVRSAPY